MGKIYASGRWARRCVSGQRRPKSFGNTRTRDQAQQAECKSDRNGSPGLAGPTSSEEEKEDEDEDSIEPEIDILNSFFIRDLELAIASLGAGDIPQTLAEYLAEPAYEDRIDLYGDIGRQKIVDVLHPRHLNRGHWLDEPEKCHESDAAVCCKHGDGLDCGIVLVFN